MILKKGDLVVCNNAAGSDGRLEVGKTYIVRDVNGAVWGVSSLISLMDQPPASAWFASRFALVEGGPTEEKLTYDLFDETPEIAEIRINFSGRK